MNIFTCLETIKSKLKVRIQDLRITFLDWKINPIGASESSRIVHSSSFCFDEDEFDEKIQLELRAFEKIVTELFLREWKFRSEFYENCVLSLALSCKLIE